MSKREAEEPAENANKKGKKPVIVWCDGCYDMMHFGHANSLRQAKEMGDILIVGVHSDEEIRKNKGPPVMNEQERYKLVRSCKWVDQVVEDAPYVTSLEIMDKYGADFTVHGDDITTTADGTDTYHIVKAAGRYRECSRTAGVSTTDLVGRMLLMTRNQPEDKTPIGLVDTKAVSDISKGSNARSPWTGVSHFLPTSRKIMQFSEGKEPKKGDKIVYASGAFDLFHVGHIDALEKAKALGDFLIVGIHTDEVVSKYRSHPVMNLHERTLSVLANKYVDEVVIGAPLVVDKDLISHFKVDIVVHGQSDICLDEKGNNPYQSAIDMGIFQRIDSQNDTTSNTIMERIIANRIPFELRNKKKEAKELAIFEAQEKNK